jgi:gamma-glutamylcyclotransferase (GGCT)/AIG2-like uncharacterized protein YtfP
VTRLFGYGTFRHPVWRAAILGAEYPAEPATLRGYCRIAAPSGYLSLRETTFDAASVDGVLIELDAIGWRIADRWEEVPKYRRVAVVVDTPRGRADATAFLAANDDGAIPVDDDRHALIGDAEVEAAIADFAAVMQRLRGAGAPSDDGE